MIEWNKYFDQIYCLFYTGQMERFTDISTELDRVGILNSGIFRFFYNTNNPFYKNIMNSINKDDSYPQVNFLRCFNPYYGHYCMIREAYERNFNRVLFLESDSMFMNNIAKIQDILHDIPEDFDMILFDRSTKLQVEKEQIKINDNYSKINTNNGQYCLFTSVAMSKRFMKWILDRQEDSFGATDDIWNDNKYNVDIFNRYITTKHMVIQREYTNKASSSIKSFMDEIYRRDNANLEDFI